MRKERKGKRTRKKKKKKRKGKGKEERKVTVGEERGRVLHIEATG
jgi:hypothetical protein